MRDKNTSEPRADKPKAFRRTRKTIGLTAKWLSPYGILESLYKNRIGSHALTPDTVIDNPDKEKVNNIAGLVSATVGVALCAGVFLWLNSADAERSTLSVLGIFAMMTAIMFLLKLRRHALNLSELSDRKQQRSQESPEYADSGQADFEADEEALGVLLFRVTTWRNAYAIGAAFAFLVFLTPSNISGIRELANIAVSDGIRSSVWNMPMVSSLTFLFLVAILAVSSLRAQKDASQLKRMGATPSVEGYVTINNNVHRIMGFAASVVLVAALGEAFLQWVAAGNVSMTFGALSRVVVTAYMILFGINTLRSCSTISGLQTARNAAEAGFANVFLCGSCRLPPPSEYSTLHHTSPLVGVSALVLFGAGLWVASNGGSVALVTVAASIGPFALIASILQFYPYLRDSESDDDEEVTQ